MTDVPEIDALFAAWLDRRLDEAGAQRLLVLLDDPAARRRWRELGDLDGWLAERHRAPAVRRRRWRPWALGALAAAALLLIAVRWLWAQPVAEVVAVAGVCERVDGPAPRPLTVGMRLPAGAQVRVAPGANASLRLGGGSIAIDGGSLLTIPARADGDLRLDAGSVLVAVDAAATAKPGVATDHAALHVAGTRFAVAVDAQGTDLAVEEGEVRVDPAGAAAAPLRVAAGQRTRIAGGLPLVVAPAGRGLRGDYYAGMDFASPLFSRVDPQIAVDWTDRGPGQGAPSTLYSVRWTGTVTPLAGGEWTFIATVDDGVRLWIDGQPVIDRVRIGNAVTTTGTATLVAGRAHRIRIDYSQHIQWAICRLEWEGPGQPRALIPTVAFHAASE